MKVKQLNSRFITPYQKRYGKRLKARYFRRLNRRLEYLTLRGVEVDAPWRGKEYYRGHK